MPVTKEKKTKGTTNNFRRFMKISPPILKIYFSTKASTELGKKVLETNERWNNKETSYQEAQQEFKVFISDAEQFVATVTDPGPPESNASLVSNHEELKVLVSLIYEDTKELLEGLTASDTGERRSAALSSFNNNLGSFQQKIEEIIAFSTSS